MNNNNKTVKEKSILGYLIKGSLVLLLVGALGWLVYSNHTNTESERGFKLGLDLAGGSQLVYEADTTGITDRDIPELMAVLRNVIEARINVFGVSEPVVQVEQGSFVAGETTHRLVVELPGVTDVDEAVAEIGRTPLLEFKLLDRGLLEAAEQTMASGTVSVAEDGSIDFSGLELPDPYVDTGLTGRYLESASLEFTAGQTGLAGEPIVSIRFDSEGAALFEQITRNYVGETLAIFLDGEIVSLPRINEPISGGTATISGGFTPQEARELAQNLNFGSLPVPIELASTQTVGATLGAQVLEKGVEAAVVSLIVISIFMIAYYRLLGFIAIMALIVYVVINLALFQYIPVTITAAGLAGFVLSIGIAVDANVLIFERFKEEYRAGKGSREATREGFLRAWSAIRDGNLTSILTAIILFWFGTAMVKGFALVFGLGVVVSMFTAITLIRTFMMALPEKKHEDGGVYSWLLGSGFGRK